MNDRLRPREDRVSPMLRHLSTCTLSDVRGVEEYPSLKSLRIQQDDKI
jgi:hypothetical protein